MNERLLTTVQLLFVAAVYSVQYIGNVLSNIVKRADSRLTAFVAPAPNLKSLGAAAINVTNLL